MIRVKAYGRARTRDDGTIPFAILLEVEHLDLIEALFDALFPHAIYDYSVQED